MTCDICGKAVAGDDAESEGLATIVECKDCQDAAAHAREHGEGRFSLPLLVEAVTPPRNSSLFPKANRRRGRLAHVTGRS